MKKYIKLIKLFIVLVIIMICILCNRKPCMQDNELTENQTGINPNAGLETVRLLLELNSEILEEIKPELETEPEYGYYVKYEFDSNIFCDSHDIDVTGLGKYHVPLLLIEIPCDREKERRIDKMLLEHYIDVLPDELEAEWWEHQELRITYRSKRYLCFRYLGTAAMPEGYSDRDMYFTLDIEKERIIGYPVNEGQTGAFKPYRFGNLYEEMEEYQEMTADEQSALRGDGKYGVKQIEAECDGFSFPCVEVYGLEDKEIQEHINMVLQEPLRQVIKNAAGEDTEMLKTFFANTKIYISYQTQKWLSVVYSIQIDEYPNLKRGDGILDFGITVDMQSGERALLDDLFDKRRLLDWFYAMNMYGDGEEGVRHEYLGFMMQTEDEKIAEYINSRMSKESGYILLYGMQYWSSFYLYKGKLMILRGISCADFEIPLPEIYEYLKVDPWYD